MITKFFFKFKKKINNLDSFFYYTYNFVESFFTRENIIWKVLNFFNQKISIIEEIKNFTKNKKKKQEILFVYDYLSSSPTYGDFFDFLMLCRFYKKKYKRAKLILINDGYRNGWKKHSTKRKLKFHLQELKTITATILNIKFKDVIEIKWAKFENLYLNDNYYILFRKKILNRRRIYHYAINFLNYNLKREKPSFINSWLINKDEIKVKSKKHSYNLRKKYISIVCKHGSRSDGPSTNLSVDNFKFIFENARKTFPQHDIFIISDVHGCKYWKKICKKNNYVCYFSKDFSKNYIDDGAIILNSNYNFQFWGGGMQFAPFSKTPYLICAKDHNYYLQMKRYKFYYWQNSKQLKYYGNNIYEFVELIKDIK